MKVPTLGQTFLEPLVLFVGNWRTQLTIYGTTIVVALIVALVADLGFRAPFEDVVQLTIFCTVVLLALVPLAIITSRLKSSARHDASETARAHLANPHGEYRK